MHRAHAATLISLHFSATESLWLSALKYAPTFLKPLTALRRAAPSRAKPQSLSPLSLFLVRFCGVFLINIGPIKHTKGSLPVSDRENNCIIVDCLLLRARLKYLDCARRHAKPRQAAPRSTTDQPGANPMAPLPPAPAGGQKQNKSVLFDMAAPSLLWKCPGLGLAPQGMVRMSYPTPPACPGLLSRALRQANYLS